jgi:hypothetical protein
MVFRTSDHHRSQQRRGSISRHGAHGVWAGGRQHAEAGRGWHCDIGHARASRELLSPELCVQRVPYPHDLQRNITPAPQSSARPNCAASVSWGGADLDAGHQPPPHAEPQHAVDPQLQKRVSGQRRPERITCGVLPPPHPPSPACMRRLGCPGASPVWGCPRCAFRRMEADTRGGYYTHRLRRPGTSMLLRADIQQMWGVARDVQVAGGSPGPGGGAAAQPAGASAQPLWTRREDVGAAAEHPPPAQRGPPAHPRACSPARPRG